MAEKIKLTKFSDPVCIWCWGSEPIYRALETHYGDLLEVEYVMGGLVENITYFYDDRISIGGGDAEKFNKQVASHWVEAHEMNGMPVSPSKMHLYSD